MQHSSAQSGLPTHFLTADYPEYNPVPGPMDSTAFPAGKFYRYENMQLQSEWIINGDSYEPVGLKPGWSSSRAFWRINGTAGEESRRWEGGEPDRHSGMDMKDPMIANYVFVDGHASSVEGSEAAPKLRDPEGKNDVGYLDPQ